MTIDNAQERTSREFYDVAVAYIDELWKPPFPDTTKELIFRADCLDPEQKSNLWNIVKIYCFLEMYHDSGRDKDYHKHGKLSLDSLLHLYWFNREAFSDTQFREIDWYSLFVAALLHDFYGEIDQETSCASSSEVSEFISNLIQYGYISSTQRDKILNNIGYTEYNSSNNPIQMGEPFTDNLSEVVIDQDCPIEAMLMAYADYFAQMSAENYLLRRQEMVDVNFPGEGSIPIKMIFLNYRLGHCLRRNDPPIRIPAEVLQKFRDNTESSGEDAFGSEPNE